MSTPASLSNASIRTEDTSGSRPYFVTRRDFRALRLTGSEIDSDSIRHQSQRIGQALSVNRQSVATARAADRNRLAVVELVTSTYRLMDPRRRRFSSQRVQLCYPIDRDSREIPVLKSSLKIDASVSENQDAQPENQTSVATGHWVEMATDLASVEERRAVVRMLKQEQLHDKHSANSAWIDRIKRRIGLSLLFLAVAASFTSVIAISRSIGSSFSELAKSANSENEQSERPNNTRNNAQTGKYVVNNRNSSIASAEIVDSIVGNDLLTATAIETAKETSEEKAEASVVKSKVVKSKVVTSSVALSSVATESVFERLASSSSRRTDSADTVGLYASLTCDLDDWCNEALAGIESIVDGNRGWIAHWVPEKSMTAWFVQASSNANVEQAAGSTSATFQDSSTLPTENQIRDASDTFERIFGDRVAIEWRTPSDIHA